MSVGIYASIRCAIAPICVVSSRIMSEAVTDEEVQVPHTDTPSKEQDVELKSHSEIKKSDDVKQTRTLTKPIGMYMHKESYFIGIFNSSLKIFCTLYLEGKTNFLTYSYEVVAYVILWNSLPSLTCNVQKIFIHYHNTVS